MSHLAGAATSDQRRPYPGRLSVPAIRGNRLLTRAVWSDTPAVPAYSPLASLIGPVSRVLGRQRGDQGGSVRRNVWPEARERTPRVRLSDLNSTPAEGRDPGEALIANIAEGIQPGLRQRAARPGPRDQAPAARVLPVTASGPVPGPGCPSASTCGPATATSDSPPASTRSSAGCRQRASARTGGNPDADTRGRCSVSRQEAGRFRTCRTASFTPGTRPRTTPDQPAVITVPIGPQPRRPGVN
jgi:hypothetical protein